jgi:hypothetical protein
MKTRDANLYTTIIVCKNMIFFTSIYNIHTIERVSRRIKARQALALADFVLLHSSCFLVCKCLKVFLKTSSQINPKTKHTPV